MLKISCWAHFIIDIASFMLVLDPENPHRRCNTQYLFAIIIAIRKLYDLHYGFSANTFCDIIPIELSLIYLISSHPKD